MGPAGGRHGYHRHNRLCSATSRPYSHLELPEEGTAFEAGDAFGTIWTVKSVDDLYTPVGGEVVEVNGTLNDAPERISEDPYGEGWIIRLRISSEGGLLSAEEYEKVIQEQARTTRPRGRWQD